MNPTETAAPEVQDPTRIGALTQEAIAALSKRAAEPDFLARRRAEAWAFCEKTPFPSRVEELWRRTDISGLKWDEVVAAREPHTPARSLQDLPAPLREEIGPAS
ncbi:MAG TPA: hypothetical protein VJQ53_01785, partial [Candidatus Eisenbacteria bacterium]|nr:hypothetical protein [Candidatus Eisenbacteria bacterium]